MSEEGSGRWAIVIRNSVGTIPILWRKPPTRKVELPKRKQPCSRTAACSIKDEGDE